VILYLHFEHMYQYYNSRNVYDDQLYLLHWPTNWVATDTMLQPTILINFYLHHI